MPNFQTLAKPLMLVLALSLAGCASAPKDPQTEVRELATQRWQALLAGQYDKAYAFAVPSYRKLKTLQQYSDSLRAVQFKWVAAEVVRADCEAERCKVVVKVTSEPRAPTFFKGRLDSGFDEVWVKEDGRWWMFETR